jgi:hypothetical protein
MNMKKTSALLILILLILPIVPIRAESYHPSEQGEGFPAFFSWQDINGTDYTTPVKDQSPAPTCEAYALCASLETLMQYQMDELYEPDLSETHLYFYAGGTIEQGYVNLVDAANYLINTGVPDEGCFPDPHRPFDYPFESLPGWEERTVKIQEWGWVNHDIESMKSALINHGPLILCFFFWKDFFYYRGGVYEHRWGALAGGHVVSIMGYNDAEECWIVKNSWGEKWGENGYFKMAYDADMIAEWYGEGTGVMYIDGVYGNLQPDVPKVQLETPNFFHTYLLGRGFSTLFTKLPFQKAAARIIGSLEFQVTVENAHTVEFYIDDVLQHTDPEAPFTWEIETTTGLHTLEVRAYNDENTALGVIDFYFFG